MPRLLKQWGMAFKALLAAHGLSFRAAMLKAGGFPSHTTLMNWASGILPTNLDDAYRFLANFSVDEARKCLKAGNLPIPSEWAREEDTLDKIQDALCDKLSVDVLERILHLIKEAIEQNKKENESSR